MEYIVRFFGGNRLKLDEINYKRLRSPRRSMAGPLYAPMKGGESIFFKNITLVAPENIALDDEAWRNKPHALRFADGFTLGLTDIDRSAVERSLRDMAGKKYVSLRSGLLIYHNLVWFIAHRESDWLKDGKDPESMCCGEMQEIRWQLRKDGRKCYLRQCTVCGKKGKMVKRSDIADFNAIQKVLPKTGK